jgi:hypothetical protein
VGRDDENRAGQIVQEDGPEEELEPAKGAPGNLVADHITSRLSDLQLERPD